MKKIIVLFSVLLMNFYSSVNAQISFFLEVKTVMPTPGFADGKVIVNLVGNYPNPVEFVIGGAGGIPYVTNDSLINLDEAFFDDEFYGVQIYAVDTVTDIYIANAVLHLFDFPVSGEFKCDSLFGMFNSSDCDGQLFAETVDFLGGPNYVIEWRESYLPDMNTDVLPDWVDLTQTNLCAGMYSILTINPPAFTQFYVGALIDDTPNFDVEIFTTPSSTSSCTGTALADVNGAPGPMQFSWDGFPVSTNVETNLCPGLYTVYATDINLDSVAALYAIVDSNHYYSDPSIVIPVDDTLFFMVENCIMDLDVMVDSVEIVSYHFYPSFVLMTFKIWQDGTSTNITSSAPYEAPEESNFLIHLTIYCLTKDIDANTFVIVTGKSEEPLMIKDETISEIKIYPNPTDDVVFINSDEVKTIKVYNSIGQLVLTSTAKTIDLTSFPKGIYQLVLFDENEKLIGREKLIVQ